MRFIEKPDCYFDTKTKLEWQKEQSWKKLTWEEAIEYCNSLGPGWHLPTDPELYSIVDKNIYNPATELPNVLPLDYWTSTTVAGYTDYAWHVYFYSGNVGSYYKNNRYYVRAVRNI